MDFDPALFWRSLPALLGGAVTTVWLAVVSAVFALAIGTFGGLARAAGPRALSAAVFAYVGLMRGVPLLVTMLFLYYGLPAAGLLFDAPTVGVTALALNSGAYVTEIVRAGIASVDRGQVMAARALGLSNARTMRLIVLPQAMRVVLPPLTNEAIALLKNTALVSVIAIPDLLRAGTDIMTWTANTFSPFAGVALIYLLMTLPLAVLEGWLSRRWRPA